LSKLGQYDLAFDAYRRGMDAAKAYNNLGVAFLEEGNFARASQCFRQAIEAKPSYYEKAVENLSLSDRMLSRLPIVQQQTLIRREPACL
jgi:Tfp pilus assembly protein PilF